MWRMQASVHDVAQRAQQSAVARELAHSHQSIRSSSIYLHVPHRVVTSHKVALRRRRVNALLRSVAVKRCTARPAGCKTRAQSEFT